MHEALTSKKVNSTVITMNLLEIQTRARPPLTRAQQTQEGALSDAKINGNCLAPGPNRLLIALLAPKTPGPLSLAGLRLISIAENHYKTWSPSRIAAKSIRYCFPLAVYGGLIAVFPPCILAIACHQPESYIGTRIFTQARRLQNKGLFVLAM